MNVTTSEVEQERGAALVLVIGTMLVVSIFAAVLLANSSFSVGNTTASRAAVQSRAAAESGLEEATAGLATKTVPGGASAKDFGDACDSWASYSVTPSTGVSYGITIQHLTPPATTWTDGCPGAGVSSGWIRILSTGEARARGVGNARGDRHQMAAVYELAHGPDYNDPGSPGSPWDVVGAMPQTRSGDAVDPNKCYGNPEPGTMGACDSRPGRKPETVQDSHGQSWVQVVDEVFWAGGYMLSKEVFDTTQTVAERKPLVMSFDMKIYRSSPSTGNLAGEGKWAGMPANLGVGDGLAFFLVDATENKNPTVPGGFGAGLGYASAAVQGNGWCGNYQGVQGGYLGVGFDVFGNYQKAETSIGGGNSATRPDHVSGSHPALGRNARVENSVGVRGAGFRHNPRTSTPRNDTCQFTNDANNLRYWYGYETSSAASFGGYRWLGGTGGLPFKLANSDADGNSYHRARVSIIPRGTLWDLKVEIVSAPLTVPLANTPDVNSSLTWTELLTIPDIEHRPGQPPLPSKLKFGFSAANGWAVSKQLIKDLSVSSDGETVIGGSGLSLGNQVSKRDVNP